MKKKELCEKYDCKEIAKYFCDGEHHFVCEDHGQEDDECPICQPNYLMKIIYEE